MVTGLVVNIDDVPCFCGLTETVRGDKQTMNEEATRERVSKCCTTACIQSKQSEQPSERVLCSWLHQMTAVATEDGDT